MLEVAPDPENRGRGTSFRNQVQKPAGILPKNAQTWVIAGLSAVMIAAIAISGNGSKNKSSSARPREAAVIDPNAARITEYRNRLEEETQRLAAEQAQLNQAKRAMGVDQHPVAVAGAPAPGAGTPYGPSQTRPDDRITVQGQLEAEKARKEYASRFASNVALSYRQDNTDRQPAARALASPPPPTMLPAYPYVYAAPPTVPTPSAGANQGAASGGQIPDQPPGRAPLAVPQITPDHESAVDSQTTLPDWHEKPNPELAKANGKTYQILEGTVLETVLTNRLAGSFSGPVNCMLTTEVYSHDRQHLLIPQGSRVLGEVKPVNGLGQQRLAVMFHRIIMPDGYSASLDQFHGLSQIGETGLRDQVNRHYLQIFGVSIAIGVIAGLAHTNTQYGLTISSADAYRQGFTTSLSESALRILDRFLNILPTFTIREGDRVKIVLASDLQLPAYEGHTIPKDF
jgi:type IV secretion system protein VirB10